MCLDTSLIKEITQQVLEICNLAWITIGTQLMVLFPNIGSIIFAGHIDNLHLDAAGIGFVILNIMVTSVILGLSSASDMLFSQTSGSLTKSALGIVVQRSLLIKTLAMFLVCSVLLHTKTILVVLGQDIEISELAHNFLVACLPGQFGFIVLIVEIKYLQAQKIVKPCLVSGLVANIIHLAYNYVLVLWWKLGIVGCGVATSLTMWTWAIILFLYIRVSKVYTETWPGMTFDCLQDWNIFLRYAIPGMLMLQMEMICFETFTLLSGLLGSIPLSLYIMGNYILEIGYSLTLGTSIACTVQIGNLLGGGQHRTAKIAAMATLVIMIMFPLMNSLIIFVFADYLPYIFTRNELVISKCKPFMFAVGFVQIFDGMATIEGGILHALGKQLFGAFCNIIALGFIAIPLAVYLMFWTPLGVMGAWVSSGSSLFLIVVLFSVKIYKTDWQEEASQAQSNAGARTHLEENNTADNDRKDDEKTSLTTGESRVVSRKKIIIVRLFQTFVCLSIFVTSAILSCYN